MITDDCKGGDKNNGKDLSGGYKDEVLKAVLRRALGYTFTESTEERDGEMSLLKQKTTTKYEPPCMAAAKLLIENLPADPYEDLSDTELEKEKQRLLRMLEENENESDKSGKG